MPSYIYVDKETGEEKEIVEGVERFLPNIAIPSQVGDTNRAVMPDWVAKKLAKKSTGWVLKSTGQAVEDGDFIVPVTLPDGTKSDAVIDPKTFQEAFRSV